MDTHTHTHTLKRSEVKYCKPSLALVRRGKIPSYLCTSFNQSSTHARTHTQSAPRSAFHSCESRQSSILQRPRPASLPVSLPAWMQIKQTRQARSLSLSSSQGRSRQKKTVGLGGETEFAASGKCGRERKKGV